MTKGDNIEDRLIAFAVRIIKLCNNLPKTRAGNHISGQLLRSGTAPAALYAEARSAESAKDFIHKLKIGLKELNESRVWLKKYSAPVKRCHRLNYRTFSRNVMNCATLSAPASKQPEKIINN